jgi:exopolyphosphatase/guanosine-5'-triphosphate,3'-diphosphate pyrophosphatase
MNRQKQKHSFNLQKQIDRLTAIRAFARQCDYEANHCEQVVFLAECLFDGLNSMFQLSSEHRFWLTCGAILHDIGWREGCQEHHKTSMRMILSDMTMPLDLTERKIVAMIARYHRKALPRPKHPVYSDMDDKEKTLVEQLAGMVRLADGLDRSHSKVIKKLIVNIQPQQIRIICEGDRECLPEIDYGMEKADLLQRATGRTIEILRRSSS